MVGAVLKNSWSSTSQNSIYTVIYLPSRNSSVYYWSSKDKHITDVLLWTPTHGNTSISRPANNNIHQLWMLSKGLT